MSTYAKGTETTAEKSRGEIEATLARFGASSFGYGWDGDRAVVQFVARDRRIRFDLAMPDRKSKPITHTPTGQRRSPGSEEEAYNQAVRERWRALALIIKAKLVAVSTGVSEFEDEFLANIVLPGGQKVSEALHSQIEVAYRSPGHLLALMPPPGR